MKVNVISKIADGIVKHTAPIQKRSPEILMGVGIVGVVGTVVLACFSTRKIDDVIEDVRIDVEAAYSVHMNEDIPEAGRTDEALSRDLALAYGKGALSVAKLYAPAVALGTGSILCLLASHNIMANRGAALAAAYSVLDAGFKKYRENVVEKYGEDIDKQLRFGLGKVKVAETETDPETGKEKKVKRDAMVMSEGGIEEYSIYARVFDESSREWRPDPHYNIMFLRAQQAAANELYERRRRQNKGVYLNEIYDMLDIERSDEGQIVGWGPDGDGFIDFGIYNVKSKAKRDFINGYEDCIILDFNVDGPLIDLR